jgi:hypothetical protein
MIIGMIKGHPTENRMARQADSFLGRGASRRNVPECPLDGRHARFSWRSHG